MIPRSYLYVPGDRADRLERAFSRDPDAVIADLEDAVAPPDKARALDTVSAWLMALGDNSLPAQVWVRVNDVDQREVEIRAIASAPCLSGLVLPKVDAATEVEDVTRLLAELGRSELLIAPMIESASGLVHLHQIAAVAGVHQLHLGEMDLAADLGLDPGADERELLHPRSQVVVASRHAGLLPPAAPVSAEISDREAFAATTDELRRLGFRGRDCIHPVQVVAANAVFSPTAEQLSWADEVLAKAGREPGAFRDSRGRMVDEAVLRRARSIQQQAGPFLA